MKPALLALLLVAACTSLVPSTVARLSALSPVEADPARIVVAVALPPGLGIGPGGATLQLTGERSDTGARSQGTYALRTAPASPPDGVDPGAEVVTLAIAPEDLAAVRAQQALIRGWEAENGPATSGSLGLGIAGCRVGVGPEPAAKGAVWLRTEADGPFLPLVRPTRIGALLGTDDIAALPPCDAPRQH
jgi:hypothetical protein